MVRITKAGHERLVCGDIMPDEGVFLSLNWGWGPMHIYDRGPRDGAHDVTYGGIRADGAPGQPCGTSAITREPEVMQGGRMAGPIMSHHEHHLLGTYCWQGPGPKLPELSLGHSFQGHLCSGVPFTDGTCDTLPWQLAQDMSVQMTVGSEVADMRPSL